METMRLTLIFLHTLIIIFSAINLYHYLKIGDGESHASAIIGYTADLLRIVLYHAASIIAVWFSRRYGAGLVRASGILLVGELLQIITSIIQHALETHHVENGELSFFAVHHLLLLIAVLTTFRLAEKISKHRKDPMQVQLFAKSTQDLASDNGIEPVFV